MELPNLLFQNVDDNDDPMTDDDDDLDVLGVLGILWDRPQRTPPRSP